MSRGKLTNQDNGENCRGKKECQERERGVQDGRGLVGTNESNTSHIIKRTGKMIEIDSGLKFDT